MGETQIRLDIALFETMVYNERQIMIIKQKGDILMSVDKSIENAIASVKMESFQIDREGVQWCKQLLEKEISMEQYINLVKQKAGVVTQ